MKPPRFDPGDAVIATDTDARVYEGLVRFSYRAPGGYAYAVEIEEIDGVLHFPERMIRPAPAKRSDHATPR